MTPAQAAWLRKLRDEGPQRAFPLNGVSRETMMHDWTDYLDDADYITPAGIAALEEWEAGK